MRTLLSIAAAATLAASLAGSAHAVEPAQHACVGQTFSEGAKAVRPLGQFLQQFVQEPRFGQGIQELQRGNVSDDVAANTCNDGPA